MYPLSHYIFNEAVLVTAWLTVAVCTERFISVCFPLKARTLCTVGRARNLCVLIFVSMSIFSIPSALRYKKIQLETPNQSDTVCYGIAPSSIGGNEQFMTVYSWLMSTMRSFLPLLILMILNSCIVHTLTQQKVRGAAYEQRHKITLMLMVVIMVFILCITPGRIFHETLT